MTESTPAVVRTEPDGINWKTSIFLIATLAIAATAVPWYWLRFGVGRMEVSLMVAFFVLGGLSITAGYHRLFAHKTYTAAWPLRLFVLLFGAATFQMSALIWASEHRYHHKFTDEDGALRDPHSIKKGFFWAHVGWLLVHVTPPLEHSNVGDLERDPLVRWQHKLYIPVAIAVGFFLPMALGALWNGLQGESLWLGVLGGFLFGGCLRIVVLHHATFLINSLAHTMGRRPYDPESSARDSGLLAVLTFGEGYHNYHHAFQTDYRNGVRPWHFDPAKWLIWTSSRIGLASNLRRVPKETIRLARLRAQKQHLDRTLGSVGLELREHIQQVLATLETKLDDSHVRFRQLLVRRASLHRNRRARRSEQWSQLQTELREVRLELRGHFRAWQQAHRLALSLAA